MLQVPNPSSYSRCSKTKGDLGNHYDPVVYRSTRAPNVPNAVSASMATTPVIVADLREDRPTQAATVVLPIRVGGVVVTDH